MMSYTPTEVRAMSFYDWACVCAGFIQFNSSGEDEAAMLSDSETAALAKLIDQPPIWLN